MPTPNSFVDDPMDIDEDDFRLLPDDLNPVVTKSYWPAGNCWSFVEGSRRAKQRQAKKKLVRPKRMKLETTMELPIIYQSSGEGKRRRIDPNNAQTDPGIPQKSGNTFSPARSLKRRILDQASGERKRVSNQTAGSQEAVVFGEISDPSDPILESVSNETAESQEAGARHETVCGGISGSSDPILESVSNETAGTQETQSSVLAPQVSERPWEKWNSDVPNMFDDSILEWLYSPTIPAVNILDQASGESKRVSNLTAGSQEAVVCADVSGPLDLISQSVSNEPAGSQEAGVASGVDVPVSTETVGADTGESHQDTRTTPVRPIGVAIPKRLIAERRGITLPPKGIHIRVRFMILYLY